jgi:isopentenyl diphosphate isomerase/L-lactate dehydrogenase-like FMN-dependent dehydrogenase
VDRGTEDEICLLHNRAVLDGIKLRPRVLVDVNTRSLETTLFGKPQSMPFAVAPTGSAGLTWYEGELALARAAKAAGVPFTLATGSQTPLEKIAREAGGTLWFQIYMWANRNLSYELIRRVEAAGYEALIVTVDTPVGPNREYNTRNGFGLPFVPTVRNITDMMLHPRWLYGTLFRYLATSGMPRIENHPEAYRRSITADPRAGRRAMRSDSLNWADIKRVRELWPRTLMIKGLMHPDDARLAVEHGADAVVLSNHGGRNLDYVESTFEVLPEIVDAVGDQTTVIVDSGIRRGSDIVKAIALGAKAVLAGRATLYGTAAGGQAGAARALELLHYEMDNAMAMLGCATIADIGPQMLAPNGQ